MTESFLVLLTAGVMVAAFISDPREVTVNWLRLAGIIALAMTAERLVWQAREHAPKRIIQLEEKLGDGPIVYASIDPADPTGERVRPH